MPDRVEGGQGSAPWGASFEVRQPPGSGALSVIAVMGPAAREVVERVTGRACPATGRHGLRRVIAASGDLVDEVCVAALAADRLELTGHAGPFVVEAVGARLERAGARRRPPETPGWARASTRLGVRVARWLEPLTGSPRVDALREALLGAPRRVVLYGRPNAGKSTLFNALLERSRAITSPEAGTTRDVLEEVTALAGVPVCLSDTGGMREAPGSDLEALGIERARRAVAGAAVSVLCLDGSAPLSPEAARLLAVAPGASRVVALTKRDLGTALSPGEGVVPADAHQVAAVTGEGLDALARRVAEAALGVALSDLADEAAALAWATRVGSGPEQ